MSMMRWYFDLSMFTYGLFNFFFPSCGNGLPQNLFIKQIIKQVDIKVCWNNHLAVLFFAGWYWGSITAAEAKELLSNTLEGSFLVRDSSSPHYHLTLSVKTELGPTHLRIEYMNGQFGFDSVVMARPHLRQFKGAVELVQYYTLAYRRQAALRELGTDRHTRPTAMAENTLKLKLNKPLYKAPPSLQHLCRIVINQHSRDHGHLPLPEMLKEILREYPFVL